MNIVPTALDLGGWVVFVRGLALYLVRCHDLTREPKAFYGSCAITTLLWSLQNFAQGRWMWFWVNVVGLAVYLYLWWRSGGDDDWRRRRRRLSSWARSHLPRPVVVSLRPATAATGGAR